MHPGEARPGATPGATSLRSRIGAAWQGMLKELSAFGIVGAVSFVLDVALFQLLYATVGLGAVTSKVLATLAAMTVAYLGHRYWSFAHRPRRRVGRQALLFALVNGSTLLVSAGIVALVRYPLGQDGVLVLQAANVAAIAIGTVVRYLSYRRWVFPAAGPEDDLEEARLERARLSTPV